MPVAVSFWGANRASISNHPTLLTNLISYWPLDESSGVRRDVHGGNDLTDNNTVGATDGVIGDAAKFRHANDEYLSHEDNSALSIQNGNTSFTFSFWLNVQNLADNGFIIDKYQVWASEVAYAVSIRDDDKLQFTISVPGDDTIYSVKSAISLTNNRWYFVVVWYDADEDYMRIQIDNGQIAESSNTKGSFDDWEIFMVGGNRRTGTSTTATIDELGFWKRALTAQERSDLYRNGKGLPYE